MLIAALATRYGHPRCGRPRRIKKRFYWPKSNANTLRPLQSLTRAERWQISRQAQAGEIRNATNGMGTAVKGHIGGLPRLLLASAANRLSALGFLASGGEAPQHAQ